MVPPHKQLGEGDIRASYSADRIGMGQPIRKPFSWQGGLWVVRRQPLQRPAYAGERSHRLVHSDAFTDAPTSYAEKVRDGDAARSDLSGFYHGMRVRHAGLDMVLSGPPVTFVPGEVEQMSMF